MDGTHADEPAPSRSRRAFFSDHPDRAAAQDEIHARPISPIVAPARVRRVVFLLPREPDAGRAAAERLAAWCRTNGRPGPSPDLRRFSYRAGERQVVWELHNEFVTFTWTGRADDVEPWPDTIGLDMETEAGNGVGLATRVDLLDAATIPVQAIAGFDGLHLCRSVIEEGRAEIATDFTIDAAGYTRFEFAAGQLGPTLTGIIVRRILEIETYRVLSLIGIPLSRAVSPAIGALERRLAEVLAEIGRASTTADNQAALARLHQLQIEAEALAHETRYRFAASRAYGRILARRLDSMGETPSGEFRSLKRYLTHRLDPALWTFESIQRRQEALNEQMANTTAMLNARIGIEVQAQTQTILATMSQTTQSQLRLQTTVEGLSTIAISYYALQIISTVLKGVYDGTEHQKALILAGLAPLVLLLTWLGIRRIHRRHKH